MSTIDIDYNPMKELGNFKEFVAEINGFDEQITGGGGDTYSCSKPGRARLTIKDETGEDIVYYECYGIRMDCKTGCQCSCGMELLIRKKESI